MTRRTLAGVAFLVLCGAVATLAEAHGTRFDVRVDALPSSTLLAASPADLVEANRQHRGQIIADVRHLASLGWALAQILTFLWLWRSGNAARLRDTLRRRFRAKTALRAAYGAALGIIAPLVGLPFLFVGYRYGFSAGLTEQTAPQWLAGYLSRIVLDAIAGAVIVVVTFWLVDRTRLWYVALAAIFAFAALGSVAVRAVVAPGVRAAHSQRLTERAAVFARDLDTHPVPVFVAPTGALGPTLVGDVVGYGPAARVVIGDVLLERASAREVDFVLAQAEARIVEHVGLRLTLVGLGYFLLTVALAVLLADRVRFRRDDDPLSRLVLLGTCLGAVGLAIYPLYAGYARRVDATATRAAIRATGDPASAVRLAVRRADDEMLPVCDRVPARWYFDTRPSPAQQIVIARGGRGRDACR